MKFKIIDKRTRESLGEFSAVDYEAALEQAKNAPAVLLAGADVRYDVVYAEPPTSIHPDRARAVLVVREAYFMARPDVRKKLWLALALLGDEPPEFKRRVTRKPSTRGAGK
jgi:hypothetical protein